MDLIKLQNQDYQVKGNDQRPLLFYFFNPMPVLRIGKIVETIPAIFTYLFRYINEI